MSNKSFNLFLETEIKNIFNNNIENILIKLFIKI